MLDEHAPLVGVIGEQLTAVRDQAARGLVAGRGEDVDEHQELVERHRAHLAVRVLVLRGEELRDDVVRGVVAAPRDVVDEEAGVEEPARVALFVLGIVVHRLAQLVLLRVRKAEEHPDHPHRDDLADVLGEVEALGR